MISLCGASFTYVHLLEMLSELADFRRGIYISILYRFEVRRWSGIRVLRARAAYTTECFVIPDTSVSQSVLFVFKHIHLHPVPARGQYRQFRPCNLVYCRKQIDIPVSSPPPTHVCYWL